MTLPEKIEQLSAKSVFTSDDRGVYEEFKAALRRGEIRSAEKDSDGNWHANAWVKKGILLGFRMGKMVEMSKSTETLQSNFNGSNVAAIFHLPCQTVYPLRNGREHRFAP